MWGEDREQRKNGRQLRRKTVQRKGHKMSFLFRTTPNSYTHLGLVTTFVPLLAGLVADWLNSMGTAR